MQCSLYDFVSWLFNVSYIGQTKRQFQTRIKKHNININKKSVFLFVISYRRIDSSYDFDWDNTRILDEESSYYKRLICEIVFIKLQRVGLNNQSDIDFFIRYLFTDIKLISLIVRYLSPSYTPTFFLYLPSHSWQFIYFLCWWPLFSLHMLIITH